MKYILNHFSTAIGGGWPPFAKVSAAHKRGLTVIK